MLLFCGKSKNQLWMKVYKGQLEMSKSYIWTFHNIWTVYYICFYFILFDSFTGCLKRYSKIAYSGFFNERISSTPIVFKTF